MRLCFAASSGGHFEQLMMLKPLMEKNESIIVTEKTSYVTNQNYVPTYYMLQTNRKELLFIPKMIYNTVKSAKLLIEKKPDAVICTGVLAMIPLCILAKLSGRKLIYLESFAKVTSATLSGKLLYKYADRFYVQWKDMLKIYPNAIYIGGIY